MLQKTHIDINTMPFNDNISLVSIYQLSARASLEGKQGLEVMVVIFFYTMKKKVVRNLKGSGLLLSQT